jgi:hypothetical protein
VRAGEPAANESGAAGTESGECPSCLRMQLVPVLSLRARTGHPEGCSAGTEAVLQLNLGESLRQNGPAHVAGADEEDAETSV